MYNLMAQGMDPYLIQKMARHNKVTTQNAYYPNIQNGTLGKVHAMAGRIKARSLGSLYHESNISSTLEDRKLMAKRLRSDSSGIPIKNGLCVANMQCPPDIDCSMCQHYIPQGKDEDIRSAYDREIIALQNCIDAMLAIYAEKNGDFEKLGVLSKELDTRVKRTAIMEARLCD